MMRNIVLLQDPIDLLLLDIRVVFNLIDFSLLFSGVLGPLRVSSKEGTKTHGDGTAEQFSQST